MWLTSWWVTWLMNFYGYSLQTAGNMTCLINEFLVFHTGAVASHLVVDARHNFTLTCIQVYQLIQLTLV